MYPEDWAIVEDVNEKYQFRNISQAMRYIVNEFKRCKLEQGNMPSKQSEAQ
jgi:hypothetical protein